MGLEGNAKVTVLHYSDHHYIYIFLKQKIKPALVSKEVIESLIDDCTRCLHCVFICSINDVRQIDIVLFQAAFTELVSEALCFLANFSDN